MHLESKLAAIGVGDLPGHLYIFMHIKIGQAQVHNSRGHTSNVMPSRVVQQWYRTLPDRLSCSLQPTPLLSPWFSQIYSNMPWPSGFYMSLGQIHNWLFFFTLTCLQESEHHCSFLRAWCGFKRKINTILAKIRMEFQSGWYPSSPLFRRLHELL